MRLNRLLLPSLPLLLLAVAPAASAQLRTLELAFTGIECASCLESLPARIQRLRGVENAKVDAAKQILSVRFAAANRIRIEQIRDAVEQDGTKTRQATVSLAGTLAENAGGWTLQLPNNGSRFDLSLDGAAPSVQYALKAGPALVSGVIANLRPSSGVLAISPSAIEPEAQ